MSAGIHNPDLRDGLARWILPATPLLLKQVEHAGTSSFGRWVVANQLRTEGGPLHALPETTALFDLARNMPELAADESRDQIDETISEILSRFAVAVVAKLNASDFGEGTFESLYNDLENYLYDYSAIPFVITVDLWHVRFDDSPISLPKNATIRQVSGDERVRFAQSGSLAPATNPLQESALPEFLLETIGTLGDVFGKAPHSDSFDLYEVRSFAHELGARLLLGLRLLGGLDVELGKVRVSWGNQLIEARSFDFDGPFSVGSRYLFETIPDFEVSEGDTERLRAIWPFISDTSGKKYRTLALAIGRFQSSFQRTTLIDRFIDQWIAIEALYGERGPEATHRMCQLLAMHVGRDAEDSWTIFRKAKEAYGIRSDVVHGRQLDHSTLEEQMKPVEDYLCRALLRCVQEKKKPDPGELNEALFIRPRPGSWD